MKLKIETLNEKFKKWFESYMLSSIWLVWFWAMIIFNLKAFVEWQYPPELLRFTIWVLIINAFIFIRIE